MLLPDVSDVVAGSQSNVLLAKHSHAVFQLCIPMYITPNYSKQSIELLKIQISGWTE